MWWWSPVFASAVCDDTLTHTHTHTHTHYLTATLSSRYDDVEKKSFLFKTSDEKRRGREKDQIVKRLRALIEDH